MPRETTLGQLAEDDIVLAVDGRWRPFPYIVSKVITTAVTGQSSVTQVRFAHGGVIPGCDSHSRHHRRGEGVTGYGEAVRAAAVAAVGAALLAACSSGGGAAAKPLVVRITDPSVAKSAAQSKFITDLYSAEHATFWRTHSQGLLVNIAAIGCVMAPNAKSDVAADFPGLSPTAGLTSS